MKDKKLCHISFPSCAPRLGEYSGSQHFTSHPEDECSSIARGVCRPILLTIAPLNFCNLAQVVWTGKSFSEVSGQGLGYNNITQGKMLQQV